MYDRLLVPTDGSETANRAVEHAVEMAREYGAELRAVYIVDTAFPGPASPWALWDEAIDRFREEGEQRLESALKAAKERGAEIETAIVEHEGVAEGILEYARENEVDAIVMGTHGRSGVERVLMGSEAERVVRSAKVPVLLVPPEQAP